MHLRAMEKGRGALRCQPGRPYIFEMACSYRPNLPLYSLDSMKALTISAAM